ncbi:hypothetical protein HKD37_13G036456 [Glycine soja]
MAVFIKLSHKKPQFQGTSVSHLTVARHFNQSTPRPLTRVSNFTHFFPGCYEQSGIFTFRKRNIPASLLTHLLPLFNEYSPYKITKPLRV